MSSLQPSPSRSFAARFAPYRRPVFSFGGAILVGYLTLTPLLKTSAKTPEKTATLPLVLPASATMVVHPRPALGTSIEGKIELAADVVGRAPVGGAVAKWLVEPGQKVQKGQPVVQISSGAAVKSAPVAEVRQTRAERAQIEAADSQLELARQLALKQSQLRLAQERVRKAQDRVADARALISKLQATEDSGAPSAPSKPQTQTIPNPERVKAESALRDAQNAANNARQAQKFAETEQKNAQKSLADAQKALAAADVKVGQVERDFDAGKATGGDVQAARADKEDAQSKVANAQTRLDAAKKELESATKSNAPLLAKIEAAQKLVAQTPETVETVIEGAPDAASGDHHNSAALGSAITEAQKALEESRAAAREAERLAARVKSYESRVHATNQQVESATEQLQTAQQQVLDSVPRPVFTEASAPQSGTVVWISRLATEVGPGDRVFGVSLGDKYGVRLEVRGDAWKRVKVGDKLPAILGEQTDSQSPAGASSMAAGVPVSVVVREIDAPAGQSGASAIIAGDLEILANSNVSPTQSTLVSAFLPSDGPQRMRVPVSSLVENAGQTFVATLTDDQNPDDQIFLMKWQKVQTGPLLGNEREVDGLSTGARILTQPLSTLPDATPTEGQASPVTIQTA